MRKNCLIKTKPLTATAKMLETAAGDAGEIKNYRNGYIFYEYTEYRTRLYFRALHREEGVLEVDLFTRADLKQKCREPRFRIFLDYKKKEDITYNCRTGRWSEAKMDNLDMEDGRNAIYAPQGKSIQTDATLKAVNVYLHTGAKFSVREAVLDFQNAVRADRLKKQHRIITDRIDAHMDTVPDLPKDFDRFIHREGFRNNQMLFFDNKGKKGYCTACLHHVCLRSKMRHNEKGRCPQCGHDVTYKSWNKQKYADSSTKASIVQKCTDGVHYVYRQFGVRRNLHRDREYEPELHPGEEYRVIMTDKMQISYQYEFGEFKNTGIYRWCEAGSINHGGYNFYNFGYAKTVLYTANLTRLFKCTPLKYIPVAEIVRAAAGRRMDVCGLLEDMSRNRFPYEAYWKMGLRRFTVERALDEDGLTKYYNEADCRKPWNYIGLSKEYFNQAVRMDAGDRVVRILQRFRDTGVRVTDEQLAWIDGHIGPHRLLEYFIYQTPHKIIRYLREKTGIEDVGNAQDGRDIAGIYTDYLDAVRKLGMDIRDAAVFFPQDMERAHDEATEQVRIMQDREEAERYRQSDARLRERAKRLKNLFDYSDDRMMISVPDCWTAFRQEGHVQHNCVAQYYGRAVNGETIILFIRKKDAPEKSFCTVEVSKRSGRLLIVQNRIIYNGEAPGEAKDFMEEALARAQMKIDEENGNRVKIPVAV